VPASHVHAPWSVNPADQRNCGMWVGEDYPAPVVNHAEARRAVLELYGKR